MFCDTPKQKMSWMSMNMQGHCQIVDMQMMQQLMLAGGASEFNRHLGYCDEGQTGKRRCSYCSIHLFKWST